MLNLEPLIHRPRQKEHPNKTSSELLSQSPRPFLDTGLGRLPTEIRLAIWKYVLIAPSTPGIAVNPDYGIEKQILARETLGFPQGACNSLPKETAHDQRSVLHVALLMTCKLIHQEATHILYSNNTFHFANASSLVAFLTSVGSQNREKLQVLHIEGLANDTRLDICDSRDTFVKHANKNAARLLMGCKKIYKVYFTMNVGEEVECISFLENMHGTGWHSCGAIKIDYQDVFN